MLGMGSWSAGHGELELCPEPQMWHPWEGTDLARLGSLGSTGSRASNTPLAHHGRGVPWLSNGTRMAQGRS